LIDPILSPAVRIQPARRCRALHPEIRQRAQRRWLARGSGASDRPLSGHREAAAFPGRRGFRQSRDVRVLEAEGIGYTIWLPTNRVLQDSIGYLLKRPVGRPPHEVCRYYASFSYQARIWNKPRRVAAKVEWHPGELYPRIGFIVTNLARPTERVVAFYNQRGTAEHWIKEGKSELKGAWMTRLKGSGYGGKYSFEGTPLVKDGVMYIITGNDDVFALNAKTGEFLWERWSDERP
jgi:hypothetical protein